MSYEVNTYTFRQYEHTHHHITWGNNVGTSTGLTNNLLAQLIDGGIIDDLAIFDNTIMALIGVWVQSDIRDNDGIGIRFFDESDSTWDNAIGIVRFHAQISL